MAERLGVGLGAAPLLARHHQSGTLHDLAHGAGRRPSPSRLIPVEHTLQLARPPRHVRLAKFQDRFLDRGRRLVGMTDWSPVQLQQALRSVSPVSPQPHIAGLPADAELSAKLRNGLHIALILKDKAQLLLHRTAHSPAHLDVVNADGLVQCQICPRFNLSGMSPVRTTTVFTPPPYALL